MNSRALTTVAVVLLLLFNFLLLFYMMELQREHREENKESETKILEAERAISVLKENIQKVAKDSQSSAQVRNFELVSLKDVMQKVQKQLSVVEGLTKEVTAMRESQKHNSQSKELAELEKKLKDNEASFANSQKMLADAQKSLEEVRKRDEAAEKRNKKQQEEDKKKTSSHQKQDQAETQKAQPTVRRLQRHTPKGKGATRAVVKKNQQNREVEEFLTEHIDFSQFDRKLSPLEEEKEQIEDMKELKRSEEEWDFRSFTRHVQRQIRLRQQIPSETCSNARTLSCEITNACGFACAMHQIGFCFVMSYATNRTLVLKQNDGAWRYGQGCDMEEDGGLGWECFFQPVSSCPDSVYNPHASEWRPNLDKTHNHLKAPYYTRAGLSDVTYKLYGWANTDGNNVGIPMYFPELIKDAVKKRHKDSRAWFVGQLEAYLFRFNPRVERLVDDMKARLELNIPYFSMHVRRTDKTISEAKAHEVTEYLDSIRAYMKAQGGKSNVVKYTNKFGVLPTIFVATDEPQVLRDLEAYKNEFQIKYAVFGNSSASDLSSPAGRWNRGGSHAVIVDLYFLAHAEFFVGTLSSQVTRFAFELQQAMRPQDCFDCTHSLDHVWYFP